MNVDRYRFDQWLLSLAKKNSTVMKGKVLGITCVKQEYQIRLKEKTIVAPIIIGADGAGSFVRRSLVKPLNSRTYVAIQQWFDGKENKIQSLW